MFQIHKQCNTSHTTHTHTHTQNICTIIQLTPCIHPIYWATETEKFQSHCITLCDIHWETKYQHTTPYNVYNHPNSIHKFKNRNSN